MSVRAGREFLAMPGPTNVPDEVLGAMHRPAVDIYTGSRSPVSDAGWKLRPMLDQAIVRVCCLSCRGM